MSLADAAKQLGTDLLIMKSYWNFQKKYCNWFFSPNSQLDGATIRPTRLATWSEWQNLASNQRKTIARLAGFKEDTSDVKKCDSHLEQLKKGYFRWRTDLYSVFWGNNTTDRWTCNIFVGDAIFLWKKQSIMASNKHYFSAGQIKEGSTPLKIRKSVKEVEIGDIVVMLDGKHVEIVTHLVSNIIADDGFCSRGAGRGNENEMGTEKCDQWFYLDDTRELDNSKNSFYYL